MNRKDDKAHDSDIGDRNGDPQRGGRPAANERDDSAKEPRPADESARKDIPSRSFNL